MKRRGAAEDENDVDEKVKKVAVNGKEEKKQLNYYAVFIMLLFALPMALTGFLFVSKIRRISLAKSLYNLKLDACSGDGLFLS